MFLPPKHRLYLRCMSSMHEIILVWPTPFHWFRYCTTQKQRLGSGQVWNILHMCFSSKVLAHFWLSLVILASQYGHASTATTFNPAFSLAIDGLGHNTQSPKSYYAETALSNGHIDKINGKLTKECRQQRIFVGSSGGIRCQSWMHGIIHLIHQTPIVYLNNISSSWSL